MEVERQLQEYSRETLLQAELERVNRENLSLKRRIASLQRERNKHKRIIGKQNKRIQQFEEKPMYINVQKGKRR